MGYYEDTFVDSGAQQAPAIPNSGATPDIPATAMAAGNGVQQETALQQVGAINPPAPAPQAPTPMPQAPTGVSNWERLSGILSLLGAAVTEARQPPSMKTGAPALMREKVLAEWRDTADRQALAYIGQLRNLAVTDPTRASQAMDEFLAKGTQASIMGGMSAKTMQVAMATQTEFRRGMVMPRLLAGLPSPGTSPRMAFLRGSLEAMGPEAFLHLDALTKIMSAIPERAAPNYTISSSKEHGIWAINPANPTDRTQILKPGEAMDMHQFLAMGPDSVGTRLLKSGNDPEKLWRDMNSSDLVVREKAINSITQGLVGTDKQHRLSETGFGQEVNVALGRMRVNPLDVSNALMSSDPARTVWASGVLSDVSKALETQKEMDRRAFAIAQAQAQLQVQKETPIGMAFKEKAHQWVDKEALQGKEVQAGGRPKVVALNVGTPFQDAMRTGINLSDEQYKDLKTMQQAHSLLDGLDKTLNRLFTTNSPALTAYRAGKLKLQSFSDSNPDAALLKASAGQLYSLASAFGAGTGRALSDRDIAVINSMVNLGFIQTQASSQARMRTVRRVITNAERIAAGVDPIHDKPPATLTGSWETH